MREMGGLLDQHENRESLNDFIHQIQNTDMMGIANANSGTRIVGRNEEETGGSTGGSIRRK